MIVELVSGIVSDLMLQVVSFSGVPKKTAHCKIKRQQKQAYETINTRT